MAQHSNYAQDRDLMMEAYASVNGKVPATSTTAMPHGYVLKESNCSDEEKITRVDLEDGLGHSEDAEHSPVEAVTAAIDAIAKGDTSAIEAYTTSIDELSATLQGYEKVAVYENLRDYIKGSLHGSDVAEDLQEYLKIGLGHSEDAEGHHPSGSDDGECDECDGYGCDVCNGTGEQDEEEVVAESYTAQYLDNL